MPLLSLPNELLIEIIKALLHHDLPHSGSGLLCSTSDLRHINAVARVNHLFHALANPILYRTTAQRHHVDSCPLLHWAAKRGRVGLAKRLLDDEGVDPNLFAPHSDVNDKNGCCSNTITTDGAEACGHSMYSAQSTALHWAIAHNKPRIVHLLLSRSANINLPGHNPRHRRHSPWSTNATETLLPPLSMAIESRNLDIAHLLIVSGANLNLRDACDETPLLKAVQVGDVALVATMMAMGADPNVDDGEGTDCLLAACEESDEEGGGLEMVRVLLSGGAKVNVFPHLLHAVVTGKVALIRALIAFGVDITETGGGENTEWNIFHEVMVSSGPVSSRKRRRSGTGGEVDKGAVFTAGIRASADDSVVAVQTAEEMLKILLEAPGVTKEVLATRGRYPWFRQHHHGLEGTPVELALVKGNGKMARMVRTRFRRLEEAAVAAAKSAVDAESWRY